MKSTTPTTEASRPDMVDAIIARLNDPDRDQRGDTDLLKAGLEILRRRAGYEGGAS
jgi:hypothetical protein